MLKASFYCLGHAVLLTENVLELYAHMVATGQWLDGRIAALLILIIINALLCCVWAAHGVSVWRQHRAERLLDRQVQQAIKEVTRIGRIYKDLLGNYGPAHKIVCEDVRDARTGEIIGKAPRLIRDDEESTNNPEEE